jgi:Ni/Co efflux regulator RcnB
MTTKMITIALGALLLAGAAPAALAQDQQQPGSARAERMRERGDRADRRDRASDPRPALTAREPTAPPTARQAPRARPAPQVIPGQELRAGGRDGRNWQGRPGGGGGPGSGAGGQNRERWNQLHQNRDRGGWTARQDRRTPGGTPDTARGGRRDGAGRQVWDGRRNGAGGQTWDGRRDGGWRQTWEGRSGGDRWRQWDGRRDHGQPRWEQGRYPSVFRSSRRFNGGRYIYPSNFYIRAWGYGDQLPYGWYGSDYRLMDWWSYDLPMPPPGYDWVRVGDDALLIDTFTGEVVQVVRYLFW